MAKRTVNRRKLTKYATGDMRDPIKIYTRSVTPPTGNSASLSEGYTLLREIESSVTHLTPGRVLFDDVNTEDQPTDLFVIRFWDDITSQNRIEYEGDYYKIVKVIDPQRRQQYLELYSKLMGDTSRETNK